MGNGLGAMVWPRLLEVSVATAPQIGSLQDSWRIVFQAGVEKRCMARPGFWQVASHWRAMHMKRLIPPCTAAIAWAVLCATAASGQWPQRVSADTPTPAFTPVTPDTTRPRVNIADVKFMQGMIAHHAQAVVMSALVPSRTDRNDLHLLAQRIDVSQKDEIKLMQRWLRARQQEVPDPDAPLAHHDAGHDMLMPGMLTSAEIDMLSNSSGTTFERLFLQGMMKHHEGALTMVKQLFATNGGGQDTEIFRYANDVDADQRAEITRMQKLLAGMSAGGDRP